MTQEFLSHQLLKTKLIVVLTILSFSFVKAQECSTPDIDIQEAANLPWFGNPDYLPSFMDSVGTVDGIPSQNPSISSIVPNIKWRVPIKFWIFTTGNSPVPTNLLDDGEDEDLPQEFDLQLLVDDANDAFRSTEIPSKIQFYMKGARQVEFHNTSPSGVRILTFLSGHSEFYDDKALNVYITTGGDAYFNPNLKEFIVLPRQRYSNRDRATSMAHEIGHYFGLFHTHQFTAGNTWCLREPVTREPTTDLGCLIPFTPLPALTHLPFVPRCTYTGDLLCDTEADPQLTDNINTATCTYSGNEDDYRGDRFTPLGDNYMAYGNRSCRATFTEDQVNVMHFSLLNTPRGRSGRWRIDLNGRQSDIFEPNNTISGALSTDRRGLMQEHILQPNIPQLHTFHKNIYDEVIDNTDWIQVQRPIRGVLDEYIITVESDIPNFIEDIEVFNAGEDRGLSVETPLLARLVSDIEPNQTRWEISIPCDSINSPNRLYLRVRRNQNLNEFGTYTVLGESDAPEISIVGDPITICTGNTYTANLENFEFTEEFSIVWNEFVIFDNTITEVALGEIVTARNQATAIFSTTETSGVYILRATITNNKTGCSTIVEKIIRIGKIPPPNMIIIHSEVDPEEACPNIIIRLRADLLEENGIDWEQVEEIEWISSSPEFPIITDPTQRAIQIRSSSREFDYTTVTLRLKNACGWSEITQNFRITDENNTHCIPHHGSDPDIQIYPNPTDDFIDIDIICLCGIDPADPIDPNPDPQKYSISGIDISDVFGKTYLQYTSGQIPTNPNGKIRLNLSTLPAGNYVLKLIMKEQVYIKHVIKQ
ncbi:hypothetical protein Fleli_2475 [Bernardetia litoralis DSM 6794]|uniref:Secretion system C-terminal sorting domain-containing protein n=1 Tax=Bernardetia litoralis (strain ATCC 23117 / DSM 6794 / NBRC 15988 / NCIMB 1366 / Fx l1 / Sio-4) TaxID=880071 RepID=I4ALK5_BERLS|nr:zinc-dependent metalloprotease [Bernardetia litoralis]AFM04840.1 hypothetical protein Fleli_2475 [Bernardetia litoralis DSM 6794]